MTELFSALFCPAVNGFLFSVHAQIECRRQVQRRLIQRQARNASPSGEEKSFPPRLLLDSKPLAARLLDMPAAFLAQAIRSEPDLIPVGIRRSSGLRDTAGIIESMAAQSAVIPMGPRFSGLPCIGDDDTLPSAALLARTRQF